MALLCTLAVSACASAGGGSVQTSSQPEAAAPHGSHTAAAAVPRSGDVRQPHPADARFMSAMIGHHAQAIRISRLAPSRTTSRSVRTLAERIINAQEDEITSMQQWLRDRGQPVPEVSATGTSTHGAGHAHQMAGMLTEAQVEQLEQASGTEFDRLFLTFMIQHHRGAVAMVDELFGTYGAAQDDAVFKIASDVNVDQTTEIARMQRMLAALAFEGRLP